MTVVWLAIANVLLVTLASLGFSGLPTGPAEKHVAKPSLLGIAPLGCRLRGVFVSAPLHSFHILFVSFCVAVCFKLVYL
tara:strand:+ start:2122 stop:2358 length:237 start_codon:yes stop_codon:yes gene_type:complete